MKNFKTLAR